jgi:hypothetical protein
LEIKTDAKAKGSLFVETFPFMMVCPKLNIDKKLSNKNIFFICTKNKI